MGKLNFNILEVRILSDDDAFVLGQWHLAGTIGDVGGYYTLLFRKIKKANGISWPITQADLFCRLFPKLNYKPQHKHRAGDKPQVK